MASWVQTPPKKTLMARLFLSNCKGYFGNALLVAFIAVMVLLMTTVVIELVYHFRPYYWSVMIFIYSQVQLGLELVVTQGTVFMHKVICLCSWLISSLFNVLCLSYDFLVLAASKASSVFWKITMIIYSQMQLGMELVITQGTVLMHNLICLCSWLLSTLLNLLRLSYYFLGLAASKASSVFWKITMIIYPQMKLGLEIVITQGTVLMHNLICLCSWLISSLFNIVRLSYDFLVLAASEASSVFWKITMIIYPQMKLGLEIVITQVTVLMQNLICFCLWLISSLFTAVRLGWDFLVLATSEANLFCWRLTMVIYSQMQLGLELVITPGVDLIFWLISNLSTTVRSSYTFIVWQASKLSSAVTSVFWWLVGNVSTSLKGISRLGSVAKRLVDSDSPSDFELIWNNWQSPVCCVIALTGTATCLIAIVAWCHGKLAKLRLKNRQYVRTDRPDAPICQEFILDKCKNGSKCTGHHCSLPYQWQYVDGQEWNSLKEQDNEKLEQMYCDVNLEEFSPKVFRRSYFGKVQITQKDFEKFAQMRRLSTESYVNSTNSLATEWIWYWKHEDGGWRKYGRDDTGKDLQELLEKAFLDKKKDSRFRISDQNYILSFDSSGDMSQKNVLYGTVKKVRRRPAKFVSKDDISQLIRSQNEVLVSNQQGKYSRGGWDPMPSTMQYKRFPLSGRSGEFKQVEKLFRESIERRVVIIGIERVQNPFMWEKYQRKKENMAAAKTGSHQGRFVNERQLFHGTSPENVEAICKQNFDWRLHGKNATAYGQGSYFALNSSYSDSYAKEDSKGSKFMFVAKVLAGSYTTGQSNYRRPPSKEPSNPASDLYDSCVDDMSCPTIFVIFDTDQFYPEYIIKYSISQGSY